MSETSPKLTTYYSPYGYIDINANDLASSSPLVAFTNKNNSLTGSINVNLKFTLEKRTERNDKHTA
jgi:hypothetical protein